MKSNEPTYDLAEDSDIGETKLLHATVNTKRRLTLKQARQKHRSLRFEAKVTGSKSTSERTTDQQIKRLLNWMKPLRTGTEKTGESTKSVLAGSMIFTICVGRISGCWFSWGSASRVWCSYHKRLTIRWGVRADNVTLTGVETSSV